MKFDKQLMLAAASILFVGVGTGCQPVAEKPKETPPAVVPPPANGKVGGQNYEPQMAALKINRDDSSLYDIFVFENKSPNPCNQKSSRLIVIPIDSGRIDQRHEMSAVDYQLMAAFLSVNSFGKKTISYVPGGSAEIFNWSNSVGGDLVVNIPDPNGADYISTTLVLNDCR